MRLDELFKPSEIKQFRNESPSVGSWHTVANEFMSKYGFTRVGKGAYGSVFIHPSHPYAIKVFRNDIQYEKWVKFCNANKGNPYLPVFKGNPIRVADGIMCLRMEILKTGKTDMPAHILSSLVVMFREIFLGYDNDNPHTQDSIRWFESMDPERYFPNYKEDKNLITVLEFLYKERDYVDIRNENIMLRGQQLVITDPLAP